MELQSGMDAAGNIPSETTSAIYKNKEDLFDIVIWYF